jgi:hypothetical protein
MNSIDIDAVIRRAQSRTCRTTTADGYCGQPATATIGGIPVCAECAEAAAPALDYIRKVMGS